MASDSTTTQQGIDSSDGVATPVNNDIVAQEKERKQSASVSADNGGPLSKSLTSSTGKAEPEVVSGGGDLEGNKPAVVQDESKLLHGSECCLPVYPNSASPGV